MATTTTFSALRRAFPRTVEAIHALLFDTGCDPQRLPSLIAFTRARGVRFFLRAVANRAHRFSHSIRTSAAPTTTVVCYTGQRLRIFMHAPAGVTLDALRRDYRPPEPLLIITADIRIPPRPGLPDALLEWCAWIDATATAPPPSVSSSPPAA